MPCTLSPAHTPEGSASARREPLPQGGCSRQGPEAKLRVTDATFTDAAPSPRLSPCDTAPPAPTPCPPRCRTCGSAALILRPAGRQCAKDTLPFPGETRGSSPAATTARFQPVLG